TPANPGIITDLAAVGSVVGRGGQLLRVDDQPVLLLIGAIPAYRPMGVGTRGRDVRQLEENLQALRYSGFTVDDSLTDATVPALRSWQRAVGLAETGEVTPDQIVFLPAPVRIASHPLRVGEHATGDVLEYTGTARTVSLDVPVRLSRYVTIGVAASVTLANGRSVQGTVADVAAAPAAAQQGDPTVSASVTLA